MKPNSQISRQSDRLNEERSSFWTGSNHPLIDYQYRTSLSERQIGGTGANRKQAEPVFTPEFRALSDKFLKTEAKQDYFFEAVLFAIIVAISAWPIASMIQALAKLVK